jgi:subtilisin family serine protease
VVAAGNDDVSACVESPASAPEAFSVGATDQYDRRAPFSDYGSCVNLNAPGVDVVSTYLGGTYTAMSGTSMAAPHVTGIAALYEDTHGATPFATLKKWLTDNATPNVPVSAPWGTPHLLAYTDGL